jgi:DNA-binding response OmpR family regulator
MISQPRLFLAVDDPTLRQALAEHFAAAGHALAALPSAADVAVVDAAVGGATELCRRLRAEDGLAVVLLAEAGLGADPAAAVDAVVAKPVRLSALAARLAEAAARRRAVADGAVGRWRLDAAARLLEDGDGNRVRLTDKETAILAVLRRAGGVVERERLLAEVWGYSAAITTHTLETHIYRLRRKIEADPAHATLLLTEGGGYRLAGAGA